MGGEYGRGGGGWRETIYLSLHFHHLNNSCIKMGSDERRFKVSLTVRDKITRQWPQTFRKERRAEAVSSRGPSAYQPNALPLGQTGSRIELNYSEGNLWRKGDNRSQRSLTYSCWHFFFRLLPCRFVLAACCLDSTGGWRKKEKGFTYRLGKSVGFKRACVRACVRACMCVCVCVCV